MRNNGEQRVKKEGGPGFRFQHLELDCLCLSLPPPNRDLESTPRHQMKERARRVSSGERGEVGKPLHCLSMDGASCPIITHHDIATSLLSLTLPYDIAAPAQHLREAAARSDRRYPVQERPTRDSFQSPSLKENHTRRRPRPPP